jgi:hypothetical protein
LIVKRFSIRINRIPITYDSLILNDGNCFHALHG